MKITPAQKRLLRELAVRGGKASPYDLAYPATPMLNRMYKAGLIDRDHAPIFDPWNCNFVSITTKGRATLHDEQLTEDSK